MQWIELVSALLCIWGVWLNARPHILGWPVGIVSVLLAAIVYFHAHLFAEFGLQWFYALSGFYGWWQWHTDQAATHRPYVYQIEQRFLIISLLLGFVGAILLGFVLQHFTTADWPWVDSALASFSLVGQIWLARKWVENWLLWMVINLISVGLYATKGLWFFAILYAILFGLAIAGYRNWRKQWLKNEPVFNP